MHQVFWPCVSGMHQVENSIDLLLVPTEALGKDAFLPEHVECDTVGGTVAGNLGGALTHDDRQLLDLSGHDLDR